MTIAYDVSHRGWSQGSAHAGACLTDKFEVLKQIGDGSFGSVSLARVRTGGAHIARRGTLVAIKTMKKTFDTFAPCLELREIIFLRTLPPHPHIVPALDIFLDPLTKKLHIAMESMDGNLYQLIKARNSKLFDASSVKSILFQILAGLEHIHENNFFHRDIKPENILVSVSAREDMGSAFKRYSQLGTPPPTPPAYTIKLADFGLARETHSVKPYTTYVSTRWYRAPEVLLRAGEYSAPVDIWAIGAMAVEIATLKPLFPGANEVDQVWRVCEIMGSPGNWVNKHGQKVGGGEWRDGVKLAQKLGFAFPKMVPHTMDTVLVPQQWPQSLSNLVTWCLMWDPKNRPTSMQALSHEYFSDALDPLRPKSSTARLLGRQRSELGLASPVEPPTAAPAPPTLKPSSSSWFRKSLVARDSAPAVPQQAPASVAVVKPLSPRLSPVHPLTNNDTNESTKVRPSPVKRNTWTNGQQPAGAPMPILPSIRPVSPLSNTVTAQGSSRPIDQADLHSKKLGRQLSLASHGNHYADLHRQEAERALTGGSGLLSPPNGQKESFFSHLRKRARRLSARHQLPMSPPPDDDEVEVTTGGCSPWASQNHHASMVVDPANEPTSAGYSPLDRKLEHVRNSLDALANTNGSSPRKQPRSVASTPVLKRHHSMPHQPDGAPTAAGQTYNSVSSLATNKAPRRMPQKSRLPVSQYETPDEQEELLDEVLASTRHAVAELDRQQKAPVAIKSAPPAAMIPQLTTQATASAADARKAYPTPSPEKQHPPSGLFSHYNDSSSSSWSTSRTRSIPAAPPATKRNGNLPHWPTPPDDDKAWAAAVAASIMSVGQQWR